MEGVLLDFSLFNAPLTISEMQDIPSNQAFNLNLSCSIFKNERKVIMDKENKKGFFCFPGVTLAPPPSFLASSLKRKIIESSIHKKSN